jgi:hypothetical protein
MKLPMNIFSRQVRSALLALVLAAGGITSATAQVALSFSSVGANSFLDSTGRMVGWEFTVDQTLEVTQLGWFDLDGNGLNTSHQVGIWDTADQSLVTSVTIAAGTVEELMTGFRYVTLGSPAYLLPGLTYRIAGFDPGTGGDAHVWDVFHSGYANYEVSGFTVDANINLTAGDALGAGAASFGYPLGPIGDERSVLMGPNMTFTVVPEPSATVLVAAGLAVLVTALRQRRGFA